MIKNRTKSCSRCGKCCTNESYMLTLWATVEDVKRWIDEHRWDILQWASYRIGRNGDPTAADLWISPVNGNERPRCPFVRKDPNRPTYRCTIYETRPQVCRDYEPWTPGTICEDVPEQKINDP